MTLDEARAFNETMARQRQQMEESIAKLRAWLETPEMQAAIAVERVERERQVAAFRARPHITDDPEVMEPGTARCIKRQHWLLSEARIYKLSASVTYEGGETRFVVVSDRGFEAMAFTCDASGELMPDGDHHQVGCGLDGHESALADMGFRVVGGWDHLPVETSEAP